MIKTPERIAFPMPTPVTSHSMITAPRIEAGTAIRTVAMIAGSAESSSVRHRIVQRLAPSVFSTSTSALRVIHIPDITLIMVGRNDRIAMMTVVAVTQMRLGR